MLARASLTAAWAAEQRAGHQAIDGGSIFADPLALQIVGPEVASRLRANPEKRDSLLNRRVRTMFAARARFAEDAALEHIHRGVCQIVILGAGLDTFAYRTALPSGCRVFEVDHPATQRWKREALAAAGINEPAALVFVPVDFVLDQISEELRRAGFDRAKPAFFSWLGVTMYLDRQSVRATLDFIGKGARGTGVVLDYLVPPEELAPVGKAASLVLAGAAAAMAEPWNTFLRPDETANLLNETGLRSLEDVDAESFAARFTEADDYPALRLTRIVQATTS